MQCSRTHKVSEEIYNAEEKDHVLLFFHSGEGITETEYMPCHILGETAHATAARNIS